MSFDPRGQISLDRIILFLVLLLGRMRGIGVGLSSLWDDIRWGLVGADSRYSVLTSSLCSRRGKGNCWSPLMVLLRFDLDPVTLLVLDGGDLLC